MVTPQEIELLSLFATLDEAQRDQLSQVPADISLAAGEYAAPQGSERALFAVLDGRIVAVAQSRLRNAAARSRKRVPKQLSPTTSRRMGPSHARDATAVLGAHP